jgi:hypothetical protein
LIAGDFAFGAQGAEFRHIPLDGPLDPLLVKRQQLDVLTVIEPSSGLRQGLADFGLVDVALVILECGFRFIRQLAEREDAGFDGVGAVEAPVAFGNGLGELLFKIADWG